MLIRVLRTAFFAILVLLWVGFDAALLIRPEVLDKIWQSFHEWPLFVQITISLVVFPVTLGLWIWESPWPLTIRMVMVISLAWVSCFLIIPKRFLSHQLNPLIQNSTISIHQAESENFAKINTTQ